ncbi:hypothetical protein RJ640_024164 [Escallonia rubra]|uniref:DELLA protein n=1 Tax=Escallonia rubra TaxID=112253 RepID=A0AA88RM72_9ASTE|nr:hypothetical protein RJ640_024164 [Escallonia rubra]
MVAVGAVSTMPVADGVGATAEASETDLGGRRRCVRDGLDFGWCGSRLEASPLLIMVKGPVRPRRSIRGGPYGLNLVTGLPLLLLFLLPIALSSVARGNLLVLFAAPVALRRPEMAWPCRVGAADGSVVDHLQTVSRLGLETHGGGAVGWLSTHYLFEIYLSSWYVLANQAVLEAFANKKKVHVIDFSIKQGLQWPALMQALALRTGGPPSFRLSGIGPPAHDNSDHLQEVGWKLAQLADTIHLEFEYRGFVANSW